MNFSLYRMTYFLREAVKNVRYSPLLTGISILTVAGSLILVGFFGGILLAADDLLDGVAQDLRVTAYLKSDVTEKDIQTLSDLIQARDGVESVVYVSEEADRQRASELLPPELLEGLDPGDLPAAPTLEVALTKKRRLKRDVEDLNAWLNQLAGIAKVDF